MRGSFYAPLRRVIAPHCNACSCRSGCCFGWEWVDRPSWSPADHVSARCAPHGQARAHEDGVRPHSVVLATRAVSAVRVALCSAAHLRVRVCGGTCVLSPRAHACACVRYQRACCHVRTCGRARASVRWIGETSEALSSTHCNFSRIQNMLEVPPRCISHCATHWSPSRTVYLTR